MTYQITKCNVLKATVSIPDTMDEATIRISSKNTDIKYVLSPFPPKISDNYKNEIIICKFDSDRLIVKDNQYTPKKIDDITIEYLKALLETCTTNSHFSSNILDLEYVREEKKRRCFALIRVIFSCLGEIPTIEFNENERTTAYAEEYAVNSLLFFEKVSQKSNKTKDGFTVTKLKDNRSSDGSSIPYEFDIALDVEGAGKVYSSDVKVQVTRCDGEHKTFQITDDILYNHTNYMFYGPGGNGKSYFLYNILKMVLLKKTDSTKKIVTVDLPMLLRLSVSNPISGMVHVKKDIVRTAALDTNQKLRQCYNSYICQFLKLNEISDGMVFLFDGLNEFLDQRANDYSISTMILSEISQLVRYKSVSVIITSRLKEDTDYLIDHENCKFRYVKLDGIIEAERDALLNDLYCDHTYGITDEVKELIKKPLFAAKVKKDMESFRKMLSVKREGVFSNYKLSSWFFHNDMEQMISNKERSDISDILYTYSFLLPLVAAKLSLERHTKIKLSRIKGLIETYRSENGSYILNIINQMPYIEKGNRCKISRITEPSPEALKEILKTVDIVSIDDNDFLSFSHDIWREMLAAKYTLDILSNLNSAAECPELILSFNFNSEIQYSIMEQLGFYNGQQIIEKELYTKCSEIFAVDLEYNGLSKDEVVELLSRNINIMFCFYQLSDHFKFRNNKLRRKIMDKFMEDMLRLAENNEISSLIKERDRLRLLELLAGPMQYHRIQNEYKELDKIYEFAQKCGLNGLKDISRDDRWYIYSLLVNQKIKADMFRCCDEEKTDEEKFNDLLSMLLQNRFFPLSANLLGCIYSTPCVKIESFIKVDILKSFKIQYETYKLLTGHSDKIDRLLCGTEIIYMARQLLSMLLTGQIRIDANGVPFASEKTIVMDTNTAQLADELCAMLEGERQNYANVLLNLHDLLNRRDMKRNCGSDKSHTIMLLARLAEGKTTDTDIIVENIRKNVDELKKFTEDDKKNSMYPDSIQKKYRLKDIRLIAKMITAYGYNLPEEVYHILDIK